MVSLPKPKGNLKGDVSKIEHELADAIFGTIKKEVASKPISTRNVFVALLLNLQLFEEFVDQAVAKVKK